MWRIAPGRQPGAHIIALVWREEEEENKFFFRLTRKARDGVKRFHFPFRTLNGLSYAEQILFIVKDLRIFHVISRVQVRLDSEQILRIADVTP